MGTLTRWCVRAAVSGILLLCTVAVRADSPAAPDRFDRSTALAVSQAAIGRPVGDGVFHTSNGVPRQISDYAGKPLVISLVFTSCHHICPTTTKHLATVVEKARDVLGEDSFSVVTLGFDAPNDTADAMRVFAAQQGVDLDGWDFLSGDQADIDALAADLGFQYYPSPSGFDHLIQSSIVDADGIVFRQVYGIQFETPHLIEPLKALVQGAGEAWRVAVRPFRAELAHSPALRRALGRYLLVLMAQRATSAGCMRFHEVGPRLARWLLMSQDRARSNQFRVTHEFLAYMLGVRRVGVTAAAGELHRRGLIEYHRGEMKILDRQGLESASCSCYSADERMYSESMP